ncbi:MAG: hypothetical protein ACLQNE_38550 [Thermoguttaceae bacterium]
MNTTFRRFLRSGQLSFWVFLILFLLWITGTSWDSHRRRQAIDHLQQDLNSLQEQVNQMEASLRAEKETRIRLLRKVD